MTNFGPRFIRSCIFGGVIAGVFSAGGASGQTAARFPSTRDWSVFLDARPALPIGIPASARCSMELKGRYATLEFGHTMGGIRPGGRFRITTVLNTGFSDGERVPVTFSTNAPNGDTIRGVAIRWGAVYSIDLTEEAMSDLVEKAAGGSRVEATVGNKKFVWRAGGSGAAAAALYGCVERARLALGVRSGAFPRPARLMSSL